MSKKYVQYTITVSVSVEEPLDYVVYDSGEEWTEDQVRDYIMEERWDFLSDSVDYNDWDVDVRIVEKDN